MTPPITTYLRKFLRLPRDSNLVLRPTIFLINVRPLQDYGLLMRLGLEDDFVSIKLSIARRITIATKNGR
jgi:hypothetical protein